MTKLNSILYVSSWCCRSNSLFDTLSTSQPIIYASSNDQLYISLLGSDRATVNPSSSNPSNTDKWSYNSLDL